MVVCVNLTGTVLPVSFVFPSSLSSLILISIECCFFTPLLFFHLDKKNYWCHSTICSKKYTFSRILQKAKLIFLPLSFSLRAKIRQIIPVPVPYICDCLMMFYTRNRCFIYLMKVTLKIEGWINFFGLRIWYPFKRITLHIVGSLVDC